MTIRLKAESSRCGFCMHKYQRLTPVKSKTTRPATTTANTTIMSISDGTYVLSTSLRSALTAEISRNDISDDFFGLSKISPSIFQVQGYPTNPPSYTLMHIDSKKYVGTDTTAPFKVIFGPAGTSLNFKWTAKVPRCVTTRAGRGRFFFLFFFFSFFRVVAILSTD